MDLTQEKQYNFTGLSQVNILLGKNGCGKSSILKKIEEQLTKQNLGEVNYITPERGGDLQFNSGVEQNAINNQDWVRTVKRKNQWSQFKNYSFSQYRRLHTLYLMEIEKDRQLPGFDNVLFKINNLLTNVKIVRTAKGEFDLFTKETNEKLLPEKLSSGESELVALAIECLTFEKSCELNKQNFLLLDEPDVHLHPDLQSNFIEFLVELVKKNKFSVIIATHSTAILGALLKFENSRFAILMNGNINASFKPLNEMYQNILPIFGAHPLSNLFNQNPILLVEGDDDVRIWQQAIRTAKGTIKFYPCSVGGIGNMPDYENSVIELLNGVYDKVKAFSLRDRDDENENIVDNLPLVRFKLSCRAAENLILSDEVLQSLNLTWEQMKSEIEKWLKSFKNHSKFEIMNEFKIGGYDRKNFDLKELRNIIIGLTETSKPWEVAVGQVIGQVANGDFLKDNSNNKICNYLGVKLTNVL